MSIIRSGEKFRDIMRDAGPNKSRGVKRVRDYILTGLNRGSFTAEDIGFRGLGIALGAIDPLNMESSIRKSIANARSTEDYTAEELLSQESAPGLSSSAFQVILTDLISNQVIEGYNRPQGLIGDKLCRTVRVNRRGTKMAGLTALAGPLEVKEGHEYEDSVFGEKYVTTEETKKGRILSLNEEAIILDDTGMIYMQAQDLGEYVRQDVERTKVRGAIDADYAASKFVYRPSGTGERLYNTDASNKNYVGSGGLTGFNAAVALQDWTDIDLITQFRATKILDDRIDGDPRPIGGINSNLTLLVPNALRGIATYIKNTTKIRNDTTSYRSETNGNMVEGVVNEILTSPYIDEIGGDALLDWYLGDFMRQFVWTEIYPVQTFTQGRDSESMFARDVAYRIKVRYFGGMSARDSIYVTKVDGG